MSDCIGILQQAYGYRWKIKKFFRSAKQKLGLNDCMARNREAQENHIMNVFLAYAFAQAERIKLRLKNVEMAIKSLKQYDFYQLKQRFSRPGEIFGYVLLLIGIFVAITGRVRSHPRNGVENFRSVSVDLL
jgi:hypothetical protein